MQLNKPLLLRIERKMQNFLLKPLLVSIIVLHLQRQKEIKMINNVLHIILVVVLLVISR